jgi:N-acetylglucosaminyldiphosphoundecaprenol N-acetyl-beta-D-mannosaminyltransferase
MQKPVHGKDRNVCHLMGLPFDVITLDAALVEIRVAIETRTRCFFSTPNLNFLVTAQTDAAFRDAVVSSDLSLADGMPIVWLSRIMGVPLPERVAGSDVFEALRARGSQEKIKVFFFGGMAGVAERAANNINSEDGGMQCVGYESPGFGSVQELSEEKFIQKINLSGADFLVVSLGALKGQAWLMHNLSRVNVPVMSHLGAVVNFVAGNVDRSPSWMQKTGLEWMWRIKEEPALWRRYFSDGICLFKLILIEVVPAVLRNWSYRLTHNGGSAKDPKHTKR